MAFHDVDGLSAFLLFISTSGTERLILVLYSCSRTNELHPSTSNRYNNLLPASNCLLFRCSACSCCRRRCCCCCPAAATIVLRPEQVKPHPSHRIYILCILSHQPSSPQSDPGAPSKQKVDTAAYFDKNYYSFVYMLEIGGTTIIGDDFLSNYLARTKYKIGQEGCFFPIYLSDSPSLKSFVWLVARLASKTVIVIL